jgi:exosortase
MLKKETAGSIAVVCVLGLLWFRLIDHLRVEWTVNPQYAYGWAVPGLCLLLLWRKKGEWRKEKPESHHSPFSFLLSPGPCSPFSYLPSSVFFAAALAYAATRLVAEANPDWRVVSWSLALEVIAITLLLFHFSISAFQRFSLSPSLFSPLFPLLFFLVSVPWPTFIETPLIQALSRANASTAVEALSWFGVPALQLGNVIEVSGGMVGIDDACSGIRSLQATLMLSLFFGEFYRLMAWRRVGCVAAGFILAFVFNVVRTTFLTAVAARDGLAAIARWHDPAGVSVLLACFLVVWALARTGRGQRGDRREAATPFPLPAHLSLSRFTFSAFLLLAWLVAVEFGVEWWYRSHEQALPKPVAWGVEFPREKPDFQEIPFAKTTEQFLRYDEGTNAQWSDAGRWQAIFLRWNPGRVAARMGLGHTPETCLTATGRQLVCASEPRSLDVNGVQFPVRFYTFRGEGGPVHVLFCLRQERVCELSAESLTWRTRLAAVMSGARNTGQRSLELALWSEAGEEQAYEALEQQFRRLVRVEGNMKTPDKWQKNLEAGK